MHKDDLLRLKGALARLNEYEQIQRDLYLKQFYAGRALGPLTGYPSIDKPWLKYYQEELIAGTIPEKRNFDIVYENNKEYLYQTALLYFGRKITYGELFEKVEIQQKLFLV